MLFVLVLLLGIESSVAATVGKTCSASSKCHSFNFEIQKQDPSYLVFVSFSMPEASLIKLAKDCGSKCRLVMRGLKNNSFKETASLLKKLEIQVDIDPEAFKKYEVTSVPTFIHLKDSKRLKGDVTFAFAEDKLKEGV